MIYYCQEERQENDVRIIDLYICGIKLDQSKPPLCFLCLEEDDNMIHIFENVICHANSQLLSKYGGTGIRD